MPWCKNCNTEYEDGVPTCTDCGDELVPVTDLEKKGNSVHARGPFSLLISTWDYYQTDLIENALENNDIPVIKNRRVASDVSPVFSGRAAFGVDLYVPTVLLEQAQDVLETVNSPFPGDLSQAMEDGRELASGSAEVEGDQGFLNDELGQQEIDEPKEFSPIWTKLLFLIIVIVVALALISGLLRRVGVSV